MKWRNLVKIAKILAFLLMVGGIVFWLQSSFWQIKKISCLLNNTDCPDKLLADLMRLSLGKNSFFLSAKKVTLQIKEDYPQLEEVKIKKNLPSGINFFLTTRQPQVAINGDKFHLVDEFGVVIEKKDTPGDYPLVFFDPPANLKIGDQFSQPEILKTISVIIGLKLRLIEPKFAKIISDTQIEIQLKDDIQTIFSLKKEVIVQLDSLQLILSRAKIEGRTLGRVDLRFDKPIVSER